MTSSNLKNLQVPIDDCEALSVDSLDFSICNDINSDLIKKCTESDKARYKIAMIDTSAHSQMQSPMTNSDYEFYQNHLRRINQRAVMERSNNPFVTSQNSTQFYDMKSDSSDALQSPGSLVKMFMQNKIHSNDSSTTESVPINGYCFNDNTLTKCDKYNLFQNHPFQNNEHLSNEEVQPTSTGNSLSTVDSNDLPLHVLDLSKKLRSMNLSKQLKYGSTSMSSNTSYTSTTTSSSATTSERRRQHYSHTNPFLQSGSDRKTKSTGTQFPEVFQDKEVQASFDDDDVKEAPVLVYYPNYSLPDLSFLEDILKEEKTNQQIYLSPVKHEPPKMQQTNPVNKRINRNGNSQRKCRPKSYTDYEMLLNQDFSHIKDWDSLNLLLPDDFKQFIEKNNLINPNLIGTNLVQAENPYPIKATISNNHHRIRSVKLRSHKQKQPPSKRYSLQENAFDMNNAQYYNFPPEIASEQMNNCMTRSQTMPNCGLPCTHRIACHPHSGANIYRNCCHPCCHSTCHSPSFNSSQTSPQRPNLNWDLLSSSSSFKKLLTFLNKLEECSSHSESSKADTQINQPCMPSNTHATLQKTNSQVSKHHSREPDHKTSRNKASKETLVRLDSLKNREQCVNKPKSSVSLPKSIATSPISTPVSKTPFTRNTVGPEKKKIILKRPTSLNKNSASGIPVPKRTSSKSMIPVARNAQVNEYRSKERFKSANTRL